MKQCATQYIYKERVCESMVASREGELFHNSTMKLPGSFGLNEWITMNCRNFKAIFAYLTGGLASYKQTPRAQ